MDDITGIGKLAETVGRGIATVLRPWLLKRDLKALAEAADTAQQQMGIPVTSADYQGIRIEFGAMAVAQIEAETRNLKEIVGEAQKALPPEVDAEPVGDEWVSRFFEDAPRVSNEELRKVWGRLLAGEVSKSGSVSLRTLDVVRNLAPREAAAFARVATLRIGPGVYDPFSMWASKDATLANHLSKFGIDNVAYRRLDEAGLLRVETGASLAYRVDEFEGAGRIPLAGVDLLVAGEKRLTLPAAYLTGSGIELYNAIAPEADDVIVDSVCGAIRGAGFQVEVVRPG